MVPDDRGGIEKNVRALQRGQACAFRIPLVPAHQRAHASIFRIKSLEAEIAGREVELFVVKRIVGDVHLAIDALESALGIKNRLAVLLETCRTPVENRSPDSNFAFA